MRNIWRIIKADARSLFTHFFALAVALVIAVLPSLYAWLNIYSNWDPYGNTGNISIAVASLDKGWTEEDGTQVNKGREVVDDLRTSTSTNFRSTATMMEQGALPMDTKVIWQAIWMPIRNRAPQ